MTDEQQYKYKASLKTEKGGLSTLTVEIIKLNAEMEEAEKLDVKEISLPIELLLDVVDKLAKDILDAHEKELNNEV